MQLTPLRLLLFRHRLVSEMSPPPTLVRIPRGGGGRPGRGGGRPRPPGSSDHGLAVEAASGGQELAKHPPKTPLHVSNENGAVLLSGPAREEVSRLSDVLSTVTSCLDADLQNEIEL